MRAYLLKLLTISGKAFIGIYAQEGGPYYHSEKCTFTLEISSDTGGEHGVNFEHQAYNPVNATYCFVLRILQSIDQETEE